MVTLPPSHFYIFTTLSLTQALHETLGMWTLVLCTPWRLYNACENQRALLRGGLYRKFESPKFAHFKALEQINTFSNTVVIEDFVSSAGS